MKRALLLAVFLIANPASAEISEEVKATCMKAADFLGCVKALSDESSVGNSQIESLRRSMKQVSARLNSGTSLSDSSLTFQPLIDAQALIEQEDKDTLAYKTSTVAIKLFDQTQKTWNARIKQTRYSKHRRNGYFWYEDCVYFNSLVNEFNAIVGKRAIEWTSSRDGTFDCKMDNYPETPMYYYVSKLLEQGSIDPSRIKKFQEQRAEKVKVQNMEAWDRHLRENPVKAKWAKANPELAEQARYKYNIENPPTSFQEPEVPEWLSAITGTIIDKTGTDNTIESLLRSYKDRLIEVQFANKGAIGILNTCATRWKEFDPKKCVVAGVSENGPSYNSGIRKGDKLIKIGDFEVVNAKNYKDLMSYYPKEIGKSVRITLKRKGKILIKEVTAVSPSELGEWVQ